MNEFLRNLVRRLKPNDQKNEVQKNGPFVRLDLTCPKIRSSSAVKQIESFTAVGVCYTISLEEQTCSCPNFLKRKTFPKDNFSRWCKHLVAELDVSGAFENSNHWHKTIARSGQGGPLGAFTLTTSNSQTFSITAGENPDWINVFGNSLRKGERSVNASGPISQYGWNIPQKRWSYRQAPPGARQLRRSLVLIEGITHF